MIKRSFRRYVIGDIWDRFEGESKVTNLGVCEQVSNYMKNICIHASILFSRVTQIDPVTK